MYLSVGTIEVAKLNGLHAGISPVQPLGLIVDGKSVRPGQVSGNDDDAAGCVHPSTLDLRARSPVCPVHVPARIQILKLFFFPLSIRATFNKTNTAFLFLQSYTVL